MDISTTESGVIVMGKPDANPELDDPTARAATGFRSTLAGDQDVSVLGTHFVELLRVLVR
jgi:hypothetical protein